MGVINIRFEGICTQIKLGQPGRFHRAVLVHAETGKFVEGADIPPHYAFLEVDSFIIQDLQGLQSLPCLEQQHDGNWQLNGARIRVANAVNAGITYQPSSYDIPSLTKLTPDFGALSKDVVLGTNAACHFDINSGTFSGVKAPRGSWNTLVEITTTDDFAVLAIEDMAGNGAGTLTLTSGSTITVSNTGGKETGDADYDFLLHYLTAQILPFDAKIPPELPEGGEGLGPGCSNSNYP